MTQLPVFLNVDNRRAAVVGEGPLAARRVEALLRAGAQFIEQGTHEIRADLGVKNLAQLTHGQGLRRREQHGFEDALDLRGIVRRRRRGFFEDEIGIFLTHLSTNLT